MALFPPAPAAPTPAFPQPPEPPSTLPTPHAKLLGRLDFLLSENLRRASPWELVRYRILVGAACFLLLLNVLYAAWALLLNLPPYQPLTAALLYGGTLLLARKSSTPALPAALLLGCIGLVVVGATFSGDVPSASTHAVSMLLPALAVYLGGARVGLLFTLIYLLVIALLYPLYVTLAGLSIPSPPLWLAHFFAAFSFMGAWGLGALHNAAKDAAQRSLEQTLKELREGERKLLSLIESTEDLVASVDLEGRVLTINSALKHLYRKRFGVELEPGMAFFGPMGPEQFERWAPHLAQALQGKRARFEELLPGASQSLVDISVNPIFSEAGQVVGLTLMGRDLTARRQAEVRLEEMHRTLVDVSRQAGMAEVATSVLHNVGNTLNSVNISTSLVTDGLRQSRVSGVSKAARLLREYTSVPTSALGQDPQAQKLATYLTALADELQNEREAMLQEMLALTGSVDHIKSIISMQQKHARTAGAVEQVAVPQLIHEALRLHAVSFEQRGIRIEQDYAQVPPLVVDRHKLLQILINLLSNARHALEASPQPDKCLTLRLRGKAEGGWLLIEVADNGVGIAPEHLPRLFSQGFTTKRMGHGFGLHISALATAELNGRLTCSSAGLGQGATFTLELPLMAEDSSKMPSAWLPSFPSSST
ncbi:sensor histidine kinase [Hyalangium rubrum]|uniref:histidine kinase n=1 Tax=Hyalangium rubrum TaxID=3103134 RepID=A0ABU5H4Z9_9BACT|nr:ATP-binding protein [Hyalangium sp. s54d21]MDY7227847.1 ATP-binding protein [Hyalangium sp. s54d21]